MVSQAKTRYKTFTYQSSLEWNGNRSGTMKDGDKPAVEVSSPPEFKGEEGMWSPEDFFVASVNICTMTTFLAFAAKKNINLSRYTSQGEGKLEFVDGAYQFTEIHLTPEIVVESEDDIELAEKTMHDSHEKCLIAKSIKAKVFVEPRIELATVTT